MSGLRCLGLKTQIRVGIHTGGTSFANNEIHAIAVNFATRMMAMAEPMVRCVFRPAARRRHAVRKHCPALGQGGVCDRRRLSPNADLPVVSFSPMQTRLRGLP